MTITQIFLSVLLGSAGLAFAFARKSVASDVALVLGAAGIAMLASMPFLQPDKDGHILLVATLPFIVIASFGATVGCIINRKFQGPNE
ncbi:MAG: hypothetical protein RL481_1436 [Pseudomonadota bacterium]|jgi:hypothetical protein